MKTISFYSYKGGVGRSLATAQLAVILARFGKSVFVIDFDFEAPGLPDKFRSVTPIADISSGMVDYIYNFINTGNMGSLREHTIKISPGTSKRGVIHFVPSGDTMSPDLRYWEITSVPEWQEFISLYTNGREFFAQLKEKIIEEFDPDYLLIDSRSGVNELAGICTRLLADTVVFLSSNCPEGFRGTNLLLRSFEKALEAEAEAPSNSYFILSRIPHYYLDDEGRFLKVSDDELDRIKAEAHDRITHGLKTYNISKTYIFGSDPLIELAEELPIKLRGDVRSSILSLDYIEFFSDLIPEISDDLKELIKEIKILRPFLLVKNKGMMINPEDKTWNVSFRVDTLLSTFDTLYVASYNREKKSIFDKEKQKGASDDEAEKEAERVAVEIANNSLFDAGRSAAYNFSEFFKKRWEKTRIEDSSKHLSYKTKLDEWCEFDSSVGFGKFENITLGEGKGGKIRLINNFLTHDRTKSEHNLCAFMRGYITRILEAIFDTDSVKVTHDLDKDCGQYQDIDPKICDFWFEVSARL